MTPCILFYFFSCTNQIKPVARILTYTGKNIDLIDRFSIIPPLVVKCTIQTSSQAQPLGKADLASCQNRKEFETIKFDQ